MQRGELQRGAICGLNEVERKGEDSEVSTGDWEGTGSLGSGEKPGTVGGRQMSQVVRGGKYIATWLERSVVAK